MNEARHLTRDEAALLGHATEHWLRLRDVEFNPGEQALKLLGKSIVRSASCDRKDIVSLAWTVDVLFPGASAPLALTLVPPESADAASGRVCVLSAVGMALIGLAVGAIAKIPLAMGKSTTAKVLATRPPVAQSL